MIEWAYFPRNKRVTPLGLEVVNAFEAAADLIDSEKSNPLISRDFKEAGSNIVLRHVRDGLERVGFKVEAGKKAVHKISVPVLFAKMGRPSQTFDADAYNERDGFIIEVEAGRAVTNYQFLKRHI